MQWGGDGGGGGGSARSLQPAQSRGEGVEGSQALELLRHSPAAWLSLPFNPACEPHLFSCGELLLLESVHGQEVGPIHHRKCAEMCSDSCRSIDSEPLAMKPPKHFPLQLTLNLRGWCDWLDVSV